jgi:hypothetical protein
MKITMLACMCVERVYAQACFLLRSLIDHVVSDYLCAYAGMHVCADRRTCFRFHDNSRDTCMHVYMYVCMYVCMRIQMWFALLCMHGQRDYARGRSLDLSIYVCMDLYVCIYVRICMYVRMYVYPCVYV